MFLMTIYWKRQTASTFEFRSLSFSIGKSTSYRPGSHIILFHVPLEVDNFKVKHYPEGV